MKFPRFFLCLLLILGFLPRVMAHQVATVELEFLKLENQWCLEGEMDIAYMLPETRGIPGGPPLSRAAVTKSSPEEFERIRKETENTLRKLIRITFAGKDVPWRIEFPDFTKAPFDLPPEAGDVALITTRLIVDRSYEAGELRVHWSGEQETELIILSEEGDEESVVSTLPGGSLMLLNQRERGGALPVEKPVTGGWVQSGFSHVIGLDHILFILGLFLLAPKWKPLVRQSLLFTLAHSLSLALAVLGLVTLPGRWVESLVAVSIAWVGIENLLLPRLSKQRMIFVFCFGLVHGLSFATILAAKLSGLPRSQIAGPLLGFNVGVELAQICILVIAFALLRPIRKWSPQVQFVGSVMVAIAGSAWAIQQIFFPGKSWF